MLCGLFLINPVGQHINLHTHKWWDDNTLIPRLKSFRTFVTLSSCIGSIVSLEAFNAGTPYIALLTMLAVFTMVLAATWNATLIPMLNMLGFRNQSVSWSIVSSTTSLIASVLLVKIWPSAISWFTGQAIGLLLGAMGARYELLRKTPKDEYEKNTAVFLLTKHEILKYCIPLSLAAGLMWIQLSGYRFAIEYYWGLKKLGYFAIGLQLAGQIWALAESLAIQFLYPFFYRRVSENSNSTEIELAVSDLLNTLTPLYLLLAGLTIAISPFLLKLLVAAEYADAWIFVAVGSIVELCRALGNVLGNAAHVRRKTIHLAAPYAVGAAIILGGIINAGDRQLDISWAGAALILGAIMMLITMTVTMYNQVKFKLDKPRILISFLIMMSLVCLVNYAPVASSWVTALGYSIGISFIVATILFMMLWNNPATLRLLSVQLRKF